jgi:hypothetical protein
MPALVPRWKIPFTVAGAPKGAQLFDPVIVEERGVLVAGGPLALSVFLIGDRQRLWYTVKPHASIAGFTVSSGALYVQDGVVLSGWHLTEHRCFAAVNLVTEERWAPESDDDEQKVPPDSLYDLPAAAKQLQSALLSARHRHWAALDSGDGDEIARSEKALAGMLSETEKVVYSAPAVRDHQFEGGSGRIFSLCMNGVLVALTDDLEVASKLNHENPPLRPELAMAELPQRGGNVLCYLYYVGKDGAIVAIDGTGDLKKLSDRWASKGAPVAEKVLPLRYVDGLLFGGGVLGADFFALELDSSRPPRLTVPGPAGGWKSYETSASEKLALLSNGKVSRLIAYDAGAKQRDRWGERSSSVPGYAIFWRGTGNEGPKPTPKLTVEADILPAASSEDVGFRVLLANTVDSEDPTWTSNYPPPASTLYTGALAGPAGTFAHVGHLRCQPAIAHHAFYCVARPTNSLTDTAPDTLVAYSMAPILNEVATTAEGIIGQNRLAAQPPRVQFTRIMDTETSLDLFPLPLRNENVLVVVSPPGDERTMRTNGDGVAIFDTRYAGAEAKISSNMKYGESEGSQWFPAQKCYMTNQIIPTRLVLGRTNTTQATFVTRTPRMVAGEEDQDAKG